MKKRIVVFAVIGLVVVLAAAYVGSTWYVGHRAEQEIHARVAAYNRNVQRYLAHKDFSAALTVADYQRGVFSSNVRYLLKLNDGDTTTTLQSVDHLVHGPFPYTEIKQGDFRPLLVASDSRLVLPDILPGDFPKPVDNSRPVAYAHTTLTFSGGGKSVWHVQPLKTPQGQVTFSGGTVTLNLSGRSGDMQLAAAFDDLRIEKPDFMQHVQDVAINGHVAVSESGTTTSGLVINVGSNASRGASGLSQKTEDSSLELDSVLAGNQLDAAVKYHVGHMQVGPVDVGSLQLSGHVSDVDMAALHVLADMLSESGGVLPTDERSAARRNVMAAFLAGDPVVALDELQWQTESGRSTASLELHLTQPDPGQTNNVYSRFLGALSRGSIDVSLSKPMLVHIFSENGVTLMTLGQRTGGLGSDFVKQMMQDITGKITRYGLVREDEGSIQTHIQYQDRTVTLNGKEMPLKQFVQHLFMTWVGFR